MSLKLALFSLVSFVACAQDKECYWNSNCIYELYGVATPYDAIRGDLRDQLNDNGCEVLSIWSLHRHGNRNPSPNVTNNIRELQLKIKELFNDPDKRRYGNICAQDLDDLTNWKWNSTIDDSPAYLTGTGYEELYNLGRRMYMKYDNFLISIDKLYLRATNEQRTATSLLAFVHGMTDGTPLANFSMAIQPPLEQDDVIRPYKNCQRYEDEVNNGQLVTNALAAYDLSPEFLAIRERVQAKLPVDYELTSKEVFTLYELCRFERSWSAKLKSPWCSFFSVQDLKVLEFRDDIRHYYRNGYGSLINLKLGALALKDLYENFVYAIEGNGKTLTSYFTHDTMLDMVYASLGLYQDPEPLSCSVENRSRLWRTSVFAAFASNLMAVLSRCNESGEQIHRIRLFVNEKPTSLCPEEGCTLQKFVEIFEVFGSAKLDFCSKETESGTAEFLNGI